MRIRVALAAIVTATSVAAQANLEAVRVSSPHILESGTTVKVQTVIRNTGAALRAVSEGALYLSTNGRISSEDRLLQRWKTAPLGKGQQEVLTHAIDIPENVDAGTYFIGLLADPENVIKESNESDNATSMKVEVRKPSKGGFREFGSGCPGTHGVPMLAASVVKGGQPEPGRLVRYQVAKAPLRALGFFVFGLSARNWGAIRLPLQFPGTKCNQLISVEAIRVFRTDTKGQAALLVEIPDFEELVGVRYFNQVALIDEKANVIGRSYSKGLETRIGGR